MLICWDDENDGDGDGDAPFRATMFHAVGLNAMAATEMSKDCLEKSMRVDSDLVMVGVVKVVVNVEVDVVGDGKPSPPFSEVQAPKGRACSH